MDDGSETVVVEGSNALRCRLAERLAAGRLALTDHAASVGNTPERAVHEARKELRRIRSLLKLLRGAEVGPVLEQTEGRLREAFRQTNPLRDGDVLRGLIAGAGVGKANRRVLQKVFATGDVAVPLATTAADPAPVLHGAVAQAVDALGQLEAALTRPVALEGVHAALARRAARGERACARACAKGQDEDVHDWRKRTKEVRYALEWLSAIGCVPRRSARPWARAAERLGRITDLLILLEAIDGAEPAQRRALRRVRKDLRRRVARRLRKACREHGPLMKAPLPSMCAPAEGGADRP